MPKPTDEFLLSYIESRSHLNAGGCRIWDSTNEKERDRRTFGKRVLSHPLLDLPYYRGRQVRRVYYLLTASPTEVERVTSNQLRVVRDDARPGCDPWCIEPNHMLTLSREEQRAKKGTEPRQSTDTGIWSLAWEGPHIEDARTNGDALRIVSGALDRWKAKDPDVVRLLSSWVSTYGTPSEQRAVPVEDADLQWARDLARPADEDDDETSLD